MVAPRTPTPVADQLATVPAAPATVAATPVDDIDVLTVLFVSSRGVGRPHGWQIVVGRCLGIGVPVAASVMAARPVGR